MYPCLRGAGFVLLLLGTLLCGETRAASKVAVAVLGDGAPGGGVFAGPGFTGWPAAAGNGWVAFRGQVSGGTTSEAMVVAHLIAPVTRQQVASVGDAAPGGGTFRQFVGRPAINARGDVAFLAQVTRVDGDPDDVTPAGIFIFRDGVLAQVVRSGLSTAAGTIDLLGSVDPNADPEEIVERTPAMNDAGDVAFLARTRINTRASGAIFLARAGREPGALVRIGDRYDGGTFSLLGPPALNGGRLLAFHGMVTTPDEPADGTPDGILDGIFTIAGDGGAAALMVSEGAAVLPLDQRIRVFGDDVGLNDAGELVFFAGPLSNDSETVGSLEDSPGIVVCAGGVLTAVAYPGQLTGVNRISSFRLGPADGSVQVPPMLSQDGHVAFLTSLDGGSREAIGVWDGSGVQLIYTGGLGTDITPAGGVYAGASSAPALDAVGGVAFRARIAGGTTSEALVYQPASGPGVVTVVGDAVPSAGFFAGKPFSAPVMNDRGDVVFRAFLARGPASVGIFRLREGVLQIVVRSGDPAPGAGGERLLDLVGQPSVNETGAVAFVGQLASTGLGIYLADDQGVHRIVATGDAAPDEPGARFNTVALEPSLNDAGSIAFRATTVRFDPTSNDRVGREGIFLFEGGTLRRIVSDRDASPSGVPFFRLRDPALTNVPSIAFRASLGADRETSTGVFVSDATGLHQLALEKDGLGSGITLSRVTGDPIANETGALAFIGTRSRQLSDDIRKPLGPSILRPTDGGLALVIAQDMPGPAGGTFRNLSMPAVNALGHIAFRASFLPFTGGTSGVFLSSDDGLEPYLTVGEATPAGGRFSSFGTRIALNAHDDLAFTATMSGTSRAGIFVASRTRLEVKPLVLHLAKNGRGRIRFNLALRLGRLSNGIDPGAEPLTISVSDARGTLWSATVNPSVFKRRGRAFVAKPRPGSNLARNLRSLQLTVGRNGTPIVTGVSSRVDLISGAGRALEAPLAVTLQVGDDAGVRPLPCLPGPRGLQCRAL